MQSDCFICTCRTTNNWPRNATNIHAHIYKRDIVPFIEQVYFMNSPKEKAYILFRKQCKVALVAQYVLGIVRNCVRTNWGWFRWAIAIALSGFPQQNSSLACRAGQDKHHQQHTNVGEVIQFRRWNLFAGASFEYEIVMPVVGCQVCWLKVFRDNWIVTQLLSKCV